MAMQWEQFGSRRPLRSHSNISKMSTFSGSGSYGSNVARPAPSMFNGLQPPRACTCLQDGAEIKWQESEDHVSLDAILNLTRQSITLWSKAITCSACSQSPANYLAVQRSLLRTWEKVAYLLEVASSAYLEMSPARIELLEYGSTPPLPATPSFQRAVASSPPSMNFGQLELDSEQSQLLIRCLIKEVLKDLGTILYKMQRMKRIGTAAETRSQIDAVLSKVLGLLAAIPS